MKHEQSRIYTTSLELVADAARLIAALPPGYGFLSDQLRRASSSVVMNFSEGSRHSSVRERRRYFTTASGSAAEVSAIADVAIQFGAVETASVAVLKDRCSHVCAMIRRYR